MLRSNVTCQECGHRAPWTFAMLPGVVRIPCVGCKEMLDVEITQEDIDKSNLANHRLPASLSLWAGVISA